MNAQSDFDDVVAMWREQPMEPRTFSAIEIQRAVRRIEGDARTTSVAMAIATVFTAGIWLTLAVLAENGVMRVGAVLTAVGYGWNAALAIHRHRRLAAACMEVCELASLEYYAVLRDIDRRIRLAGAGWPAYVGFILPPLIYFAGAAAADPKSWVATAAMAVGYAGFHVAVLSWGRRNAIATYDEMARYRESRGLL